VCVFLYVRRYAWNNWTPTGQPFMKFGIRMFFFRKYAEKIQIA